MQYMVVFLADISKKYYLCRYNVTIKLADRWKTNTIGVTAVSYTHLTLPTIA